jgi:pimeloyl-ACP methyl ester carboxylesterase
MKQKKVFKSIEGRQKIIDSYRKTLEALPVKPDEQYIQTSFGKTYTINAGDKNKPAVVYLHGSSSNSSMWLYDMAVMAADHYVVSVDIIGEPGSSEPNRLDLGSKDYALWLDEVIVGLGIEKPALIGNSYGGWLALKYAGTFPEKVSAIVLIAASGIVNVKLKFVIKSITFLMQGKKGLLKLNEYVFGTKDIPKQVLENMNLVMDNFNPMTGGLPVFGDEHIKGITAPILFIAGERDVTMDARKAGERLKAMLPETRAEILKDTGHVVFTAVKIYKPFIEREKEK